MPFTFQNLELEGLVLITSQVLPDERGEFAELYQRAAFTGAGIEGDVVQVNYSKSKKDVVRGLHYQLPPKAQGKIVQVSSGSIFDVAVDIRKDSKTYGKWLGVTLSAEEKNMLYIPKGFAHGFCSLEEGTEVVYYCTDEYSPDHQGGIVWNDPAIGITWPVQDPIISQRDANYPVLQDAVV